MSDIAERLEALHRRVQDAAHDQGRDPRDIQVLAVSKRHPSTAIRAAHAAGQRTFGESYLQEAIEKQEALADLEIEWHLVGSLQSNKAHEAAQRFDWVHTLDRSKIARRLSEARPTSQPPLNCCLQVNISDEPQKAGCSPGEVERLAAAVEGLPQLRLRGLMAIPAPGEDPEAQRKPFARLRSLLEELRRQGHALDTLSMGMTHDLEAAIAEGATVLRIGTALFGTRPHP